MLKRAKVVGEVTRGGAHPGGMRNITPHFGVGVPMGRSINPVSKTNWEGSGVKPNVKATEAQALDVAYLIALRSQKKRMTSKKLPRDFVPNLADEIEKALAKAEAKVGGKRAKKRKR
jgi:C-terminal processing protease CtpA/Prc